jgi:hypothetical protein
MKKIWEKPELVVLARSRPEENVLGFCKTGGDTSTSPIPNHVGCMQEVAPQDCIKCSVPGPS